MRRTTVFGLYDGNTFGAIERVADHVPAPSAHQPRQRLWRIVAKRTVLATGAIERPIVFKDNDRPGVMMASAVRTYLNRFRVTAGRRVALFTSTDDGWRTVFDLENAGIPVAAIVDSRPEVAPTLLAASKRACARTFLGAQVIGTQGARSLQGITVRHSAGHLVRLPVDALAMSGGWNPTLALSTHLGGHPRWCKRISGFIPGNEPSGMTVAGAARGSFRLSDALWEGSAAGAEAAESAGFRTASAQPATADDECVDIAPYWFVPKRKAFVDFQHDVTAEDIALSAREGFRSAELLKRYTALGMATDQGKTSSVNGLAILAALTKSEIEDVGTTGFRPPYAPVAVGAFAGSHRGKELKPTRLTAGHRWAQERGATFVEAGQWLRPRWFALPDEKDWLETVTREVAAVRSGVGVCDVSTLGKIDMQGSDSGAFLDRVYINMLSTLSVGKVRYALMLRGDGFVLDDGTSARLAADHYLMWTTTANAARVMQHLEYARQAVWPQLDVQIVSITEQWAQYAIAGIQSRRLLQRLLGEALDVSDASLPYMACAEFSWRGITARVFRVSFSGELAYELAVPARYGDATIRAIMAAGSEWNVVPYGTEALGVMRIEKGHVAANEINGMTTAADLGLNRMMSSKKDFIGRVLADRSGLTDPSPPALVGIRPVDRGARLHAGAHFIAQRSDGTLKDDQGYVTSVAYSPTLQTWIGLGMLRGGLARQGERVRAFDPLPNGDVDVEVVPPVFLDPEGLRLRS